MASDHSSVHAAAAQGFEQAAEAYEQGRPDYPAEAVRAIIEDLAITPGCRVVDLGAGTGKLARLLVPSGANLVAVEPVAAMRAKFAAVLPAVPIIAGTAEALPLADASCDVVIAAQAFHWFATAGVLGEIARVLKPGGRLALMWNIRDESVDYVAELSRIIRWHDRDIPTYETGAWRTCFSQTDVFTPLRERAFRHAQRGTVETILARVASVSYIAALPAERRAAVLADVRQMLATHPKTRGQAEITMPYHTVLYWCTRR